MRIPTPTRRDLGVAAVTLAATLGGARLLPSQAVELPSSVFDWTELRRVPTAVGARRDIFRSRTATLEQMSVHVTTIAPGREPHPPHRHPDEEIILVKEGTIEQTAGGVSRRIGPGSLAFLAPGDEHGILNVGPDSATYYIIRWTSSATARAAAD